MERILVVEDDSFFREVFTDLLKADGYVVEVAASGEEALEKIRRSPYQLVVTDLVMPDVTGLDILSAVKRHDPAIDVIMVTGHANVETAIYALKNGATDYLVKPINHDEFRHIVAHCMQQRRLLDENQELKGLVSLFHVSQAIGNSLDVDRIFPLLMDALCNEMGGTSRGLGYLNENGQLVLHEIKGIHEMHAPLLGQAVVTESDLTDDGSSNMVYLSAFLPEGEDYGEDLTEAVCFYLRQKSSLHGVIILFNNPHQPLRRDVNRNHISFLLDQGALALENAARYNFAKDLLYIDELTGLYNYRYLEVVIDRELKRSERYGSPVSVLFLDIDLFKMVNDMFGHLIGSKVLREVGHLLRKNVRDLDAVIRYGGDEYTIILVETGVEGAAVVAERIRKAVEAYTFARDEGLAIKLTVSLGYACSPDDGHTKKELLELADQAMYRGKASGKNLAFHALPRDTKI